MICITSPFFSYFNIKVGKLMRDFTSMIVFLKSNFCNGKDYI